jgi:hypothetical protein
VNYRHVVLLELERWRFMAFRDSTRLITVDRGRERSGLGGRADPGAACINLLLDDSLEQPSSGLRPPSPIGWEKENYFLDRKPRAAPAGSGFALG